MYAAGMSSWLASVVDGFKVLSQVLPGETEENLLWFNLELGIPQSLPVTQELSNCKQSLLS
jgi:hypothetical protein